MNPTCDCKQARHTHGDNVMYSIHGCRCDVCKTARSDMERKRRRTKLYGRYHLTDAEPARKHIRALMAAGMGWKRVAEAAQVSPSSVHPILYGRGGYDPRPPRKQISKTLEAKLLAVTPDMAPGSTIESTGTARRLQALAVMGWSQHRLARMLNMEPTSLNQIIHRTRRRVLRSTAENVEAIFDAGWNREPKTENRFEQAGVTRAKREAAEKGWVPAAAWDDIDNLAERPKGSAIRREAS